MNNHIGSRTPLPRGQRGGALIISLIVISVLAVVVATGMPSGVAAMKRINAAKMRHDEKWLARGRVATGDDFLYDALRSHFKSDLQAGRVRLGGRVLPAFDASDVPPASSVPVMRAGEDGTTSPTGCESSPGSCTSILGNVNSYLGTRGGLINSTFFTNVAVPSGTIKLADIRVVEKRTMTQGGETAFRVEYVLDATGGDNGRARQRGEVIFGVNDAACGTTVGALQSEQTIMRGQPAAIQVNYTRSKTLVLMSGGVEIERRSVQDELNTQTATFTVAPVADQTYTVDAGGTGTCAAQTFHTVHVQQPICPVNQLFDVTPDTTYGGGQVTVSWQVGGPPDEVRLNGAPVSAAGSMTVTVNSDTSFTLDARDSTNQCPFSATKAVRVLPCPGLNSFDAEGGRTTVTRGDPPVNLVWNVGNVAPGARVLLNGVDVPAAGSQAVTPDVTSDYTLVVQPPPGSACPPVQRTIRITVIDRGCPQLQLFEPSAPTLTEGDVLMVRWAVAQATSTTSVRLIGPGVNELVAPTDSRAFTLAPGTYLFRLEVTSSYPECPGTQAREFSVTVNAKPTDPTCDIVIRQFDPDTSCALPGSVVRLNWNVTSSNPSTRVQINGSGSYPLAGSADFTVNSSQTFTLSADAPNCAAQTAARFVEVAQPAPTVTNLSASPNTTPMQGQAVTVFYGASGAQTATINGSTVAPDGSAVNPAGGSFSFVAAGPVDFTFAATSGGCSPQSAARTIQIRPSSCPVPVIQLFRTSPPSVPAGGQTLFEWSVANAEPGASVSITGPGVNLTGLPASGNAAAIMPVAPGTYYFTITVANPCAPGNTVSQTVGVVVTCAAPQITGFSVNPPSYVEGSRSAITFNWTTADPSGSPVTFEISSVGGGLPAGGTVDATAPPAPGTYSYTGVARNACGAASAPVTVQVTVTPNTPGKRSGHLLINRVAAGIGGSMTAVHALRQNLDGSVDVSLTMTGFALGGNITVKYVPRLFKNGVEFYTDEFSITNVSGSCKVFRVPASSVPPGADPVEMRVVGHIYTDFTGLNPPDQVTVDSRLPPGTKFTGDSAESCFFAPCTNQDVIRFADWDAQPPQQPSDSCPFPP